MPPFRHLLVTSHQSCVAVSEARVDGAALYRIDHDSDDSFLEGAPVSDEDVDDREGIVHKVAARHKQVGDGVIRGAVGLVLVDVKSVVCVQYHTDVVRLHGVVESLVRIDRHVRGPRRIGVVQDENDDAANDAHDVLLELTGSWSAVKRLVLLVLTRRTMLASP